MKIEDVDDIKRLIEILKKRDERILDFLKKTLDYDFTGKVLTDGSGNLLYVNKKLRDALGYELSELIGKSLFIFLHPDDIAKTVSITESYNKGELESSIYKPIFTNRYKRKDGTYQYLNWWAGYYDTELEIGIGQCKIIED